MSKQKILAKAIEKAEKNKFNLLEWWDELEIGFCPVFTKNKDLIEYLLLCKGFIPLLLTDHTFARALWKNITVCSVGKKLFHCEYGKKECESYNGETVELWKWHLQQMVVSDDWLVYVEGTLDE